MAKKSSNKRKGGKSGKGKAGNGTVFDSSRSSYALTLAPTGVHRFLRTSRQADVSKSATDSGYQVVFNLGALPNSTEFTTLFDVYRIDKVDITFVLDLATVASTVSYPRIVFAPDWNDSTPPTFENDVLSYQQAKSYQFSDVNRELTISMVPAVARTVFATAVTSGYGWGKEKLWLDSAYPTLPHFGLKFFLNNYNSTSFGGTVLRYYTRYHLSFANPK